MFIGNKLMIVNLILFFCFTMSGKWSSSQAWCFFSYKILIIFSPNQFIILADSNIPDICFGSEELLWFNNFKHGLAHYNFVKINIICFSHEMLQWSVSNDLHSCFFHSLSAFFTLCAFCFLGSRWGGPVQSIRESNAGWCGPQALDRTTREHPNMLGSEALSKRDSPASVARV